MKGLHWRWSGWAKVLSILTFSKIGISKFRIFQKLWPNPEIVQGGSGGAILEVWVYAHRGGDSDTSNWSQKPIFLSLYDLYSPSTV